MKWREVLQMPVSEATRRGAEQMARLLRTDVRDLFAPRSQPAEAVSPSPTGEGVTVASNPLGSASAAVAMQPRPEVHPRPLQPNERRFEYEPGEILADTFSVSGAVGVRGAAKLFRAQHLLWGCEVLLVVPQAEWLEAVPGEAWWASLASRWSACGLHPHLQYCFEERVLDQVPCLILEPVEGKTLRAWVAAGRTQPLRVALELAIQLCQGLSQAHERGLFHGGLTPESVWVDDNGILRLAYFGLHFPREAVVEEAYVAPERWVDEGSPELAADLFALGVCLYELLCGVRPYEVTRGPRREPVDPARRRGEPLPEALCALLRACVDWEPMRRPSAVREVSEALHAAYRERFGTPSSYARVDVRRADAGGWNNQGMVALARGSADDAEAAWQTALAHDPQHLEAGFNLALSRWRRGLGSDQEVLRALERARPNPGCPWRADYLAALARIEAGDGFGAKPFLERIAAELSGEAQFEDLLRLARRSRSHRYQGRELKGHSQFVSAVGVGADGRWIVSGSDDHTVVVWDALSGNPVRILEGHEKRVSCLALTPDASKVLTGSEDFTLRLWDVQRGRCECTLRLAGQVFAVAISADGRRAVSSAAGSDNFLGIDGTTVALWDLERGRVLCTFEEHSSAVKAVALTPDGRYLATGSDDQTVRVWDTTTGRCIRVLRGHTHNVSCVAVSADGKRVVSGSWDRTVRLWDARAGRCLAELGGHEGIVTTVCVDAEAKTAVTGSWDGSVRVWDLESKRCIRAYAAHQGLVTGVALSASAQLAVSGGWDNVVRLWDVPQPGPLVCQPQLSLREYLPALDVETAIVEEDLANLEAAIEREDLTHALFLFSRLEPRLSQEALRPLRQRLQPRMATRRLLATTVESRGQLPGSPQVCNWAAGLLLCAGSENELYCWRNGETRVLASVDGEVGPVRALAVSPDARSAACAGLGRVVTVVDTSSGARTCVLRGHSSVVSALLWLDEVTLASASYDGTVRVWEPAAGRVNMVLEGSSAPLRCLAAGGGQIAAGDWSGAIHVWEGDRGRHRVCLRPTEAPVRALEFLDPATLLVGAEDGSVVACDLTTGECTVWQVGGQAAPATSLRALWDGRRVFTAHTDGRVCVWDVADATAELLPSERGTPLLAGFLEADGSELLVVAGDGSLVAYRLRWDWEAAEPARRS